MSSTTAERHSLDKLPRWARHEIQRLRSDLESCRRDLAMALGGAKTDIEVEPYREGEKCYLSPRSTVRYWIGPRIDDYVDVRLLKYNDGSRRVSVHGSSLIQVEPSAANVVHVKLQER